MAKFFPLEKISNLTFSAPFWPQNGHFHPKMVIFTYFSQSRYIIFQFFQSIHFFFLTLKVGRGRGRGTTVRTACWPQNGHFSPKMAILTYFSKSVHWMLLIFAIETNFLILKKMTIFFSRENLKFDFSAPFWPQNGHLSPKTAILTYFSKSVHWMLLIFAIETNFLVFKKMTIFFLRKISNLTFRTLFDPKMAILAPKRPFWPISPNLYIGGC